MKVGICPPVASSEHKDRLAPLSPWIHLHLSGEYVFISIYQVNISIWLLYILIDAFPPPEPVASLTGPAQPVCIRWLKPEPSRPSCYRYLVTLFGTCNKYLPCSSQYLASYPPLRLCFSCSHLSPPPSHWECGGPTTVGVPDGEARSAKYSKHFKKFPPFWEICTIVWNWTHFGKSTLLEEQAMKIWHQI